VAETASGADGDDEEHVLETLRLTGRDCNSIQCFCSYKVHDFILLFRCHPGMDFDIRQKEVPFSGILSFGLPLLHTIILSSITVIAMSAVTGAVPSDSKSMS
jgi:hypothetical protein